MSKIIVNPSQNIFDRAEKLLVFNIKYKDALHLSSAIEANADYFITTDYQLIKKKNLISDVKIISPIHFIENLEVKNGEV